MNYNENREATSTFNDDDYYDDADYDDDDDQITLEMT